MKKTIIVAALLAVVAAPAFAQSGRSTSSRHYGSVPPAPVGHRQPRAADVPDEKNLSNASDPMSKENRDLDKKIKSICRGC
ncbi:MAG: hypothetical protein FWD68_02045 [Alphaproteobacteria bacterium]|nr:hypothetical protein [Alphaproteobacteria bacterium]